MARKAVAASRVSRSPKASATTGSYPARRADCARARPENAAIRTVSPVTSLDTDEFFRQRVGMAEVECQRLVGGDHLLEEARLALVLDVADSQRADAERGASRKLFAIHEKLHAFDAGRRHGIDVGDDLQILGELLVFLRHD